MAIVTLTPYAICGIIFVGSLLGIIFEPILSQNADNVFFFNKDEKSLTISGIWKEEIPFGLSELGIACEKQKYSSTEADKYNSYFGRGYKKGNVWITVIWLNHKKSN